MINKIKNILMLLLILITTLTSYGKEKLYRMYEGLTFYIYNPAGMDFSLKIKMADLNFFEEGAREILFKVYAPDGRLLIREFLPDDGITNNLFKARILGWDQELQYYASMYLNGREMPFRWTELVSKERFNNLNQREIKKEIKANKIGGIYRIVLAGSKDIMMEFGTAPDLEYGVVGHPEWLIGNDANEKRYFLYVPKDTVNISFAIAEPDQPATRIFKLIAPDGTILAEEKAEGVYKQLVIPVNTNLQEKVISLNVSEGKNAYMVHCNFNQPSKGVFADYVGIGSLAIFCETEKLASLLKGGTISQENEIFWHPFQIRLYDAIRKYEASCNTNDVAARKILADLKTVLNGLRLIVQSDARGASTWHNLAYSLGYSGCKIFRPAWLIMNNADVPAEIKETIKEALIMTADRLSVATGIERVNGNAFSQINVALWYASQATQDRILKERFEIFWNRWANGGWGRDCGVSSSGDVLESFGHDMHYGSYILANWLGTGPWINNGIINDAKDDMRFAKALQKISHLYSYTYCREENGTPIPANPWSSRTSMTAHNFNKNWETHENGWKANSPSNFIVSINGANEWFAAKQNSYYLLVFAGKITPILLGEIFDGQCGFGGGIIAQFTIPNKGPVLASTLYGSYGEGMHLSQYKTFHIHTLAGTLWDGSPFVSANSEPAIEFSANRLKLNGEIRKAPLHFFRTYEFTTNSINISVAISNSYYQSIMHLWKKPKKWAQVKEAFEIIPFLSQKTKTQSTYIFFNDTNTKILCPVSSNLTFNTSSLKILRDGYGAEIILNKEYPVIVTINNTLMVDLIGTNKIGFVSPEDIKLEYKIVPITTK